MPADIQDLNLTIGVLALQGAFVEHGAMLQRLSGTIVAGKRVNITVAYVRNASQLSGVHGLIIGGGESTAMWVVQEYESMFDTLRTLIAGRQLPVFGTCAGLILLANEVVGATTKTACAIGGLDVQVTRNYYGNQRDSFIAPVNMQRGVGQMDGVFIRAPRIMQLSANVTVLATLDYKQEVNVPVAIEQGGHLMAATFHPELTDQVTLHRHFAEMVVAHQAVVTEANLT